MALSLPVFILLGAGLLAVVLVLLAKPRSTGGRGDRVDDSAQARAVISWIQENGIELRLNAGLIGHGLETWDRSESSRSHLRHGVQSFQLDDLRGAALHFEMSGILGEWAWKGVPHLTAADAGVYLQSVAVAFLTHVQLGPRDVLSVRDHSSRALLYAANLVVLRRVVASGNGAGALDGTSASVANDWAAEACRLLPQWLARDGALLSVFLPEFEEIRGALTSLAEKRHAEFRLGTPGRT